MNTHDTRILLCCLVKVLSVYDLPREEALRSLRFMRRKHRPVASGPIESDEVLESVLDLVGGRTSLMSRLSRAPDMLRESACTIWQASPARSHSPDASHSAEEAKHMVQTEKAWLLSKWVHLHDTFWRRP